LAPAFPALAEVPPDTSLGRAPFPGVSRIFHVPELRSLAERLHALPAPEDEICIQRPVAVLDAAQILDAMKRELPEARIELLDFSRQPAPLGTLEFPVSGLRQTGSGYWNGSVRYGANQRFHVWAKVKV